MTPVCAGVVCVSCWAVQVCSKLLGGEHWRLRGAQQGAAAGSFHGPHPQVSAWGQKQSTRSANSSSARAKSSTASSATHGGRCQQLQHERSQLESMGASHHTPMCRPQGRTACSRLSLVHTLLLSCRYYSANNGVKPGCLLVYRDGVSDSELDRVRVDEVTAIIEVGARNR